MFQGMSMSSSVAVGSPFVAAAPAVSARPWVIEGYNEAVVRKFVIATLIWAVIGMCIGVFIASELAFPLLNFAPYGNFGRLRPSHTTAVILGFTGNALFATSLYVVQRTCRTGLFGGPRLANFLFWGYQTFIVVAISGYIMGANKSLEYAEAEWYDDLWLAIVWVTYIITFVGTLAKRKEPHIYVANWFFLSFVITVGVLWVTNNLTIPIDPYASKSYPVFAGVQSAMVQWWYGHNMVGFLLTDGVIGMMYYFLPKQAERPIYSYRLSIVHFWALIFLYIWAGPHHLQYTALPDWTQSLGVAFSIMLWIPSWGGMVNGIMTVSGVWDKLRTDPILRFLVVSVAFYGMATFEGPLMAIPAVNGLSHYTNWTIGHVHSGALGWVAFMIFGSLYHLVPRLWRQPLYSMKMVEWHFWLASIGILLYVTSMWVAGISQGLMWKAYDNYGFLRYSFVESVAAIHPYYVVRAIGGGFYLIGAIMAFVNMGLTILKAAPIRAIAAVPAE